MEGIAGLASRAPLGLLPVLLFLVTLVYLDSYKLVRLRAILQMIVAGAGAAAVSYLVNGSLLGASGMDPATVTRYLAPFIEEVLKALPIMILLRMGKVGFLVDAAIIGFATGTGFALVENLYYLWALPESSLGLWVVRGFGTALMHGGTTAILAITTKLFSESRESAGLAVAIPGFLLAFGIHSFFNHFLFSPIVSAALIILILPPLLFFVFVQSERFLQHWLGTGFDLDAELLETIHSGEFAVSRPGRYLQSLRDRFDGATVADMLCYMRLHSELALRAKGILLMRENGFPVKRDAAIDDSLAELRFLKKSMGRTGELALAPILRSSSRDVWQLGLLEKGAVDSTQ